MGLNVKALARPAMAEKCKTFFCTFDSHHRITAAAMLPLLATLCCHRRCPFSPSLPPLVALPFPFAYIFVFIRSLLRFVECSSFPTAKKKDGSYRTRDQLTSKWSHINKKVRKFMGVYEECSRSRRSGTNDADVLRVATTRYQDDGNQGKVPIDLWTILSRSPKWQQLNNPDGGSFRKRSTVDDEVEVDETIGSTDQIPSFNVADSDDEDPIPRPIGRKKAKSIASSSGGSASISASPRDEIGRAMVEQLRAFNLQEHERLKLKEKELKIKEQEAEMKVMQTDPGTLSEFGRIIYEQRMREIKEKYNIP
ncbi:unnamed protein product [Cuscuta campestris]|uniref:No apical meristem-associated C-terminal domain-containing protein n=1 Tax=Cuscuta campestris TaxID=132261 RepID=A0A484KNN5_9ASTE|nr:unnamed protein product [Cuscuta campestris]